MPHYKVHYLDARGRVTGRFEFRCIDDAEAEQACEALADQRAHELWCGARWIKAWPRPVAVLPGA